MAFVSTPYVSLLWNLWKRTGKIGPSSLRIKITSSSLADLFAIILVWRLSEKRHLGFFIYLFMAHHFCCSQDYTQECAQAHITRLLPLVVLALEAFQKAILCHPRWHQRKRANQTKSWWHGTKSIWDAIKSTPGASPPHLGGRARRDE